MINMLLQLHNHTKLTLLGQQLEDTPLSISIPHADELKPGAASKLGNPSEDLWNSFEDIQRCKNNYKNNRKILSNV